MICSSINPVGSNSRLTMGLQTVLLVCIHYGSEKVTERYLESLCLVQSQANLQVLVVDNSVGGIRVPESDKLKCRVARSPRNLGYLGGARYGLSEYLKENCLPDWIIISNVDLTISDQDFFQRLQRLRLPRHLGMVAPSIRSNLTCVDQNPYMRTRPSPLRMHLYKWLYKSRLALNMHELASAALHKLGAASRRARAASRQQNAPRQAIYAAHGSFLIFNKSYFERGGDLDYPQFLFGEEIYIAEKMRSLNLSISYEPSLVVVHEEHRSTKLFKSPSIARYVACSAAHCADHFFPLHSRI